MKFQDLTVKTRSSAAINVHLVLKKENQVLLSLRKNTGYFDGYYGLVAGHVEEGESAILGLIREAREEIGILIFPQDLKMTHIMHRKTNRNNIDLFFECCSWSLDIANQDPEKCKDLKFHPLEDLPSNIIPYISFALKSTSFYSEAGWEGVS